MIRAKLSTKIILSLMIPAAMGGIFWLMVRMGISASVLKTVLPVFIVTGSYIVGSALDSLIRGHKLQP
jgi:hypothetical protein